MSISKIFILEALFQKNYFPSQKRAREEMPPILSTESFTVDVAKLIHAEKRRSSKNYSGYDQVEYKQPNSIMSQDTFRYLTQNLTLTSVSIFLTSGD